MLNYICCILAIPLVITIITLRINKQKIDANNISMLLFLSNIIINIVSYILQSKLIISIEDFNIGFYMSYIIIEIVIIYILEMIIMNIKNNYKVKIYYYKISTIISSIIAIICFIYFGWLLELSGRMSISQFFYNMNTPVNTSTGNFYDEVIPFIMFIILMIGLYIIIVLKNKQLIEINKNNKLSIDKHKRSIARMIPILLMVCSMILPIYTFNLQDIFNYLDKSEDYFKTNYVNPNDVNISFPTKKRNLVYIFVESFESSMFSKELGGIDDVNELEKLTPIMEKGVNFSNNNYYGGAISLPATTWTIAGMSAHLGGVNYNMPLDLDESKTNVKLLPGLVTLGEILNKEGYTQKYMIGAIANNYNLGPFFKYHNNAEIIDLGVKKNDGSIPMDYLVHWGFEDKKLFGFAKEELEELAKSEQPFALTISTNDTHGPKGYTDEACSKLSDDPYVNSIRCTDSNLSEFLNWIQEQSFYENTTVVVVGDHLGLGIEYYKKFDNDNRRIFNLILNHNSPYKEFNNKNRNFGAIDMFPTVVSSLGANIEGNKLGLGVNLFSNEQTLIEKTSTNDVINNLTKGSEYFNDKFVYSKTEYK
ncbi:MAG: LTA synthase family protein [Erysipelotrichaceae bacterium]